MTKRSHVLSFLDAYDVTVEKAKDPWDLTALRYMEVGRKQYPKKYKNSKVYLCTLHIHHL